MSPRRSTSRRPLAEWLLPRRSPPQWLRRRRWAILLLIVAMAAWAGYDHFRHGTLTTRPEPSRIQPDDTARYDGRTFRVIQTVDGDTVHIDVPDKGKPFTIIRLWGVDTPEVHGGERPAYFGPEASRFTHALADNRQVRLELVPGRTRDRYNRLLAYIHLPDGSMLNERLIAEGYAYADTRFPHHRRARFVQLEDHARSARVGLWAGVTPADMPPWRRKREWQPEPSNVGAMLPICPSRGTFPGAATFCL